MTDREMLQRLEEDPEAGMAALIDAYSGLLWKAASGRLHNQEDIRDCVSETFSEFYLHRENFDPEKGTLAGYLAAIARRRALRRWDSNMRQNGLYTEPAEGPDPFRQIEQRAELDEALSRLEAEDEKILRMKYYQGLSAKEIAAALGLPYETVKKRHQRSLSKLRKWLIAGLILALVGILAACAYVVLRHFGIIPGYGPVSEPGASVWVLAEPATAEFELGTVTVKEAVLVDGRLSFTMDVVFPDRETDQLFCDRNETADLNDSAAMPSVITNGTVYVHFNASIGSMNEPDRGLTRSIVISSPNSVDDYYVPLQPPEDGLVELRWGAENLSITFSLQPVTAGSAEDYSFVYHELAGLAAISRREEERLLVELYPMPTGEGYKIESKLLWGRFMEGRTGDITLTGADGQVYTGAFIPVSHSSSSPRDDLSLWDFGAVEPGEYTLCVPYLFLCTDAWPEKEKGEVLPIDLVEGTWEDTPVDLTFGSVRVTGLEPLGPGESFADWPDAADCPLLLRLTLQWEPPEGLDMTMVRCYIAVDKSSYTGPVEKYFYEEEPLPENVSQWYLGIPEEMEDWLDQVKIRLSTVQSYRWEQSFEMTITVE